MLKMRNPNGNAVFLVKNERRRKELEDLGFTKIENKVDLDKMTVKELEAYAVENGIDLSGCENKDKKLAKIKESIKE